MLRQYVHYLPYHLWCNSAASVQVLKRRAKLRVEFLEQLSICCVPIYDLPVGWLVCYLVRLGKGV